MKNIKNLIISDLRTKEELRHKLVSDIYLAGFHGYLTVVRPVDGRFDSLDIDLFLGYDNKNQLVATIDIYESEEVYYLAVFPGETTVQLLTRVRDRVLKAMEEAPDTEAICGELLAQLKKD